MSAFSFHELNAMLRVEFVIFFRTRASLSRLEFLRDATLCHSLMTTPERLPKKCMKA